MFNLVDVVGPHAIRKPLSLRIKAGEMVGVIGANGAGKTTLLRLMSGALPFVAGVVELNDQRLATFSPRERARILAYLPQFEERPDGFTVRDLVFLGRYAHRKKWGGYGADDVLAVDGALQALELDSWSERDIQTLSGGEYQRVRLGRALAQSASGLILDEPVAHLDLANGQKLLQQIYTLNRCQGLTVVAALHDLNLASIYFSRLIVLREGEIVADGSPNDVLTTESMCNAFGTDSTVITHPQDDVPQVLPHGLDGADL